MRGKPFEWYTTEQGCIVSTSHKTNQDGYLRIRHPLHKGKGRATLIMAHRFVWEQVHDCSIQEGYEIDHLCKNRGCINPTHLQLLTRNEHLVKTNTERYLSRKNKAKAYWKENKKVTGIKLGEIFNVSFSSACRWIREWKGVETIQ